MKLHDAIQVHETHKVGEDVQARPFATCSQNAGAAGEATFTGTSLLWCEWFWIISFSGAFALLYLFGCEREDVHGRLGYTCVHSF